MKRLVSTCGEQESSLQVCLSRVFQVFAKSFVTRHWLRTASGGIGLAGGQSDILQERGGFCVFCVSMPPGTTLHEWDRRGVLSVQRPPSAGSAGRSVTPELPYENEAGRFYSSPVVLSHMTLCRDSYGLSDVGLEVGKRSGVSLFAS